jgi:hypothetical protein
MHLIVQAATSEDCVIATGKPRLSNDTPRSYNDSVGAFTD